MVACLPWALTEVLAVLALHVLAQYDILRPDITGIVGDVSA